MQKTIIKILGLCLCFNFAYAELNIKTYKEQRVTFSTNNHLMKLYIGFLKGVSEGIIWTNVMIKTEKKVCVPENLHLEGTDYLSILDREIKLNNNIRSTDPISLALLVGFMRNFPCK